MMEGDFLPYHAVAIGQLLLRELGEGDDAQGSGLLLVQEPGVHIRNLLHAGDGEGLLAHQGQGNIGGAFQCARVFATVEIPSLAAVDNGQGIGIVFRIHGQAVFQPVGEPVIWSFHAVDSVKGGHNGIGGDIDIGFAVLGQGRAQGREPPYRRAVIENSHGRYSLNDLQSKRCRKYPLYFKIGDDTMGTGNNGTGLLGTEGDGGIMVQLAYDNFIRARDDIFVQGDDINRAWFQYIFEGNDTEMFLRALSHYQQEDGGLGGGEEMQGLQRKYEVYYTLAILEKLDRFDRIAR